LPDGILKELDLVVCSIHYTTLTSREKDRPTVFCERWIIAISTFWLIPQAGASESERLMS
jgi:hypothetical protein